MITKFPKEVLDIICHYAGDVKTVLALQNTCKSVQKVMSNSDDIWKKFQAYLCFRQDRSIYFKDYCPYFRSYLLCGMGREKIKRFPRSYFTYVDNVYCLEDGYEPTDEEVRMILSSSVSSAYTSVDDFVKDYVQEDTLNIEKYTLFYTDPKDALFNEITYYGGDNLYGHICMEEYDKSICKIGDTIHYYVDTTPKEIRVDTLLGHAWELNQYPT